MVSLLPFFGGEGPGMRGFGVRFAYELETLSGACLVGFSPNHAGTAAIRAA